MNKFLLLFAVILFTGCYSTPEIEIIQFPEADEEGLEIKIPRINIANLPFQDAVKVLNSEWQKHNRNTPLPQIIILDSTQMEREDSEDYITEDPLTGKKFPDWNIVTLVAEDLTVLECLDALCLSTGSAWLYKVINGNIVIYHKPSGIIEGWETKLYRLSPLQAKFLNIKKNTSSAELVNTLSKYGIFFPEADTNVKARWDSGINGLIVFTYFEQHQELALLLKYIPIILKEEKETHNEKYLLNPPSSGK